MGDQRILGLGLRSQASGFNDASPRLEEILKKQVHCFYEMPEGYIVWRNASGDNCELLHLKVHVRGKGFGEMLFRKMLEELKIDPPYCTVFGFTRIGNFASQNFYTKMGFEFTKVRGVYKEGGAVLFSQDYEFLCKINRI